MHKLKSTVLINLIFLLASFATFMLQDFDFINLKNNACSLYTYKSDCALFNTYAVNKFMRLTLNLLLLFLLDYLHLKLFVKNTFIWFVSAAIFLLSIDLFLATKDGSFVLKMHNILNTVLYSPLVILVYIANSFKLALQK